MYSCSTPRSTIPARRRSSARRATGTQRTPSGSSWIPPTGREASPDALGFPGDMTWINTGAIFARASFANAVISNRGKAGTYIDTAALLKGKKTDTPADVVNALADRFGLADAAPATRAVWEKYVD